MNPKTSLSHREQEPESGVLYVVGTPIGNLMDVSSRTINILKNVSLIACEDTRQTKKIMNSYFIKNKLISFNKINSLNKIPKIISFLKENKTVALVSDAGMPSICDPGENLIKNAKSNGIDVICIPGPCAAITALVTSGFPSSKFIFEGFLPKQGLQRERVLEEISQNKKTTIIYESPHRLKQTLEELKIHCGDSKEIQVSRELTKRYEENICTNLEEIIKYFDEKSILGEITIVIKGNNKENQQEFNKDQIKKELIELVEAGLSLSAASKYLAKKKNVKKNLIYKLI